MVKIEFDGVIFREGDVYIGYSPKLDVSSCGNTLEEARSNLRTAERLFIEEAGFRFCVLCALRAFVVQNMISKMV